MSKEIRIGFLLLHKYGGRGGTEVVLKNILSSLTGDIETFIYFVQEPNDFNFILNFKNSRCFRVPRLLRNKHLLRPKFIYNLFLKVARRKLFSRIKEDKLDIVFILDLGRHLNKNLKHLKSLKKNSNLKIVSWTHTRLPVLNKNEVEALNIFDSFFAISTGISEQVKNYGFNNVHTVYNPIKKANLVKRVDKHFIYIGRIDSNKRVKELVNLFSEISEADFVFDIYGSTGTIVEDKAFIKHIESKNLMGKVNFYGWKDDPWQHIDKASVLLLNSKKEGFPLVLAEAMMRGIPCLSSNCETGPADIIKHNINGWLYEVDDESALKKYIEKIIQGVINMPEPLTVQASVEKFSYDKVLENFKEKMLSLIP